MRLAFYRLQGTYTKVWVDLDHLPWSAASIRITIKSVAPPGEGTVPSAARVLKAVEVAQLASIARALPSSWCVQLLPPHGQLSITPLRGRPVHHRCFTAAAEWGAVRHEKGCTGS